MTLEKKLIAILANIPTTLRGGNHGHAGILMEPTRRRDPRILKPNTNGHADPP
jgi:hypothetical protein